MLYRVVGPSFCAGFITDAEDRVRLTAPLLRRPLAGQSIAYARTYCRSRGWVLEELGKEIELTKPA